LDPAHEADTKVDFDPMEWTYCPSRRLPSIPNRRLGIDGGADFEKNVEIAFAAGVFLSVARLGA
jgi:hypothetical protein